MTPRLPNHPITLTPTSPPYGVMASRVGPRSVKDATRFTSNIPHATSKAPGRSAAATPKPSASSRLPGETPEQRVRRLRQAHLAAQNAQISKADRAIDMSRRFLDAAHRFTVGGVILFTGRLRDPVFEFRDGAGCADHAQQPSPVL